MAPIIVTSQKESSHYYLATGESCHGDLRSARKQGAYPSVTTILGAAGPSKQAPSSAPMPTPIAVRAATLPMVGPWWLFDADMMWTFQ